MEVAKCYQKRFSTSIKDEAKRIENGLRVKRRNTSIEKVNDELLNWILDIRFFRSRDTKYFRMV